MEFGEIIQAIDNAGYIPQFYAAKSAIKYLAIDTADDPVNVVLNIISANIGQVKELCQLLKDCVDTGAILYWPNIKWVVR